MALTLFDISKDKGDVSVQDIRGKFDEDAVAIVDEQSGRFGMFCLFDVDKFKHMNDNYGHAAGDTVLINIADAMKKAFRTSDVLIRLGGDEFVVFAEDVPDEDIGARVIDRFMMHIQEIHPEVLKGHHISISLGAVIVRECMSFEDMYAKADSLMYECKKISGNSYMFFNRS